MHTLTTSVGAVFALIFGLLQREVFAEIDVANALVA